MTTDRMPAGNMRLAQWGGGRAKLKVRASIQLWCRLTV